jgi:hypothetical protein
MVIAHCTDEDNLQLIDNYIGTAYDNIVALLPYLDCLKTICSGMDVNLKYLGAHVVPPTTRLDGSPIEDGDYYFDTAKDSLNYWDEAEAVWFELDPSTFLKIYNDTKTLYDNVVVLHDDVTVMHSEVESWFNSMTAIGGLIILEVPDAVVEVDARHHGHLLVLTNTGDVQVNINEALDEEGQLKTGGLVFLRYDGEGVCNLVPAVGVNVFSPRTLKFAARYSTVALISNNQTEWTVAGDLEVEGA